MQFMNSCLHKLVKNLSDEGFKHLVEEFGPENLELLKQQCANPYEYMKSFERFNEKNYLLENIFTALQRMKISDGYISLKDYLTSEKNWDNFDMKDMSDYHDNNVMLKILWS